MCDAVTHPDAVTAAFVTHTIMVSNPCGLAPCDLAIIFTQCGTMTALTTCDLLSIHPVLHLPHVSSVFLPAVLLLFLGPVSTCRPSCLPAGPQIRASNSKSQHSTAPYSSQDHTAQLPASRRSQPPNSPPASPARLKPHLDVPTRPLRCGPRAPSIAGEGAQQRLCEVSSPSPTGVRVPWSVQTLERL